MLEKSTATVEEAAEAIGCLPKQIAKTMSFLVDEMPILIVTAGDAKIDNKKYKNIFHQKARMIHGDQVESFIGHAPGGVCPFAVNSDVTVFTLIFRSNDLSGFIRREAVTIAQLIYLCRILNSLLMFEQEKRTFCKSPLAMHQML